MSDSTSRVWGLLVERGCERTPPYPHLRRVADHLEQQEEHPTASRAGEGTPTPPAMTLVVGGQSNGAASRGCGQKQRETFLLREQHGGPSDTTIAIIVQRKSKAK